MAALSVVIPVHNEAATIRRTVESFLDTAGIPLEILVVDDRSTDGGTDALSQGGSDSVRVLHTPRQLGVSGARNYGATAAGGDVLVFADGHIDVAPGWTEAVLDAVAQPDVGIVGPGVRSYDPTSGTGLGMGIVDASPGFGWIYDQPDLDLLDVPVVPGMFSAMRREVFDRCGRWDEGMGIYGSEDAEMSIRLWLAGYRNVVAPAASIRHMFRMSSPYILTESHTAHNLIRLATLHFSGAAMQRVVEFWSRYDTFSAGMARVIDSDVWRRRDLLRAERRRSDAWYIERFDVGVLR